MELKAGYPFPLIKSGLVASYPKLEKDTSTDVLVMGGGISGALAAHHLIREGIDCVVADARSIGLGSTCASTSLLQYEIDTPLHTLSAMIGEAGAGRAYNCCLEAIGKLQSIAETIGFTDIQSRASLYYAASKKHVNHLEKEYEARKKLGLDVFFLGKDELKRQTGIDAPAAILSASGAQTNAYLFTHALHQYNIRRGLRVYDRTIINKIEHHADGVTMGTANGFTITAKKLVYATGYEVINYIDKPIVTLRSTYAMVSEAMSAPPPYWPGDALVWNTADPYLYMRTTTDSRILVGGRDEKFFSPAKRDAMIPLKTKKLVKDFNKVFPGISFIPEFSWTGIFGSTKDGLPYIGPYHKLPNSLFALGFGGNGITFSLIAAEMISGMILGKNDDTGGIFSFERS